MNDVLVCEISGKRPGTSRQRPTEKLTFNYDKVIISNNSDGYITDWPVVMVPDDYKQWYVDNVKSSDNAWYAPMNRSYAIKYARERGYKYLVELDDNIISLMISYRQNYTYFNDYKFIKEYRRSFSGGAGSDLANDMIGYMQTVAECTNAGMVGMGMSGAMAPDYNFISERYVYSFFLLALDRVPDVFQGDFEDDIEFRLKLAKTGVPAACISPFKYEKTYQGKNKDLTGCRKEYAQAGLKRGEHMRELYGDIYSCGTTSKPHAIRAKRDSEFSYFKHRLKPVKVGLLVRDQTLLDKGMSDLLSKYALLSPDSFRIKTR